MKKFLLSIAIVAFSMGSVFAQENSAEKLRWKGIMNNGFWSNWEIGIAGGINGTAWNDAFGTDQGAIGDLGWQIEGNVTKWFNPIVGARVQLIGGRLNASDDYLKNYWIMPHADAVLNLSNWFGGYREDRVYYAKVFAGAGVNFVNVNNDGTSGFAGVAGLINTFRVCKQLDINLELKGILSAGRDMPRGINTIAAKYGQIYSATLGIAYRFNKRDWNKAYSQEEIDAYLASIAALESSLADAHRNEGKLAERLAAQKAATDQALKDNEALRAELAKRKNSVVSSSAIFFNFDSARLTDRAKASMQVLQETIAAAPKDQVFTIVGHADVKTGSAAYNQKLSEKRAKAVYDYLVEQGVNKDQLTWKGVGSSENIFPVNNTNRVVIVK
ncbi:MAG: OmpA family protein [Rikenellaceae bacterium]|nr:OmpA family protein [Rikenellaceae bacterium]